MNFLKVLINLNSPFSRPENANVSNFQEYYRAIFNKEYIQAYAITGLLQPSKTTLQRIQK